ncbi:MAG: slipin family protein, partial [Calditrichaeota bacterium]|nr:slipin family protein [Calditrichota bacterium]
AEGEFQASKQLMEAAKVISPYPVAVQLRYLQTLSEIATENNSTTVFPIPLDMMGAFVSALKGEGEKES